jgi:hypothetical protein
LAVGVCGSSGGAASGYVLKYTGPKTAETLFRLRRGEFTPAEEIQLEKIGFNPDLFKSGRDILPVILYVTGAQNCSPDILSRVDGVIVKDKQSFGEIIFHYGSSMPVVTVDEAVFVSKSIKLATGYGVVVDANAGKIYLRTKKRIIPIHNAGDFPLRSGGGGVSAFYRDGGALTPFMKVRILQVVEDLHLRAPKSLPAGALTAEFVRGNAGDPAVVVSSGYEGGKNRYVLQINDSAGIDAIIEGIKDNIAFTSNKSWSNVVSVLLALRYEVADAQRWLPADSEGLKAKGMSATGNDGGTLQVKAIHRLIATTRALSEGIEIYKQLVSEINKYLVPEVAQYARNTRIWVVDRDQKWRTRIGEIFREMGFIVIFNAQTVSEMRNEENNLGDSGTSFKIVVSRDFALTTRFAREFGRVSPYNNRLIWINPLAKIDDGHPAYSTHQIAASVSQPKLELSLPEVVLEFAKTCKDGGKNPADPVGGVAFQSLPMTEMGVMPQLPAMATGAVISSGKFDCMLKEVRMDTVKGGMPCLKIKKCIAAARGIPGRLKAIATYITNILNKEEADAAATSPEMKELLTQLG